MVCPVRWAGRSVGAQIPAARASDRAAVREPAAERGVAATASGATTVRDRRRGADCARILGAAPVEPAALHRTTVRPAPRGSAEWAVERVGKDLRPQLGCASRRRRGPRSMVAPPASRASCASANAKGDVPEHGLSRGRRACCQCVSRRRRSRAGRCAACVLPTDTAGTGQARIVARQAATSSTSCPLGAGRAAQPGQAARPTASRSSGARCPNSVAERARRARAPARRRRWRRRTRPTPSERNAVPGAATPMPAALVALSPAAGHDDRGAEAELRRDVRAQRAARFATSTRRASARCSQAGRVEHPSDQSRAATSRASVPAASDMSDMALPVNRGARSPGSAASRRTAAKTWFFVSRTHSSLGAVKPASRCCSVMRRSAPRRSIRRTARRCARRSIAGSPGAAPGSQRVEQRRAASGPTGRCRARRQPAGCSARSAASADSVACHQSDPARTTADVGARSRA